MATLEELAEIGARREGRAVPAFERLVDRVHVSIDEAAERLEAEASRLRVAGGEERLARALALSLQSNSLAALGPRASRALLIGALFQQVVLIVLVLVELVVVLVLYFERDRLLSPQPGGPTLLLAALALQLAAVPWLRRWIERKLVWGAYDETLADLTAALAGLDAQLADARDL